MIPISEIERVIEELGDKKLKTAITPNEMQWNRALDYAIARLKELLPK